MNKQITSLLLIATVLASGVGCSTHNDYTKTPVPCDEYAASEINYLYQVGEVYATYKADTYLASKQSPCGEKRKINI